IDAEHPSTPLPTIKFIDVTHPLYIGGSAPPTTVVHLDFILFGNTDESIQHRFLFGDFHFSRRQGDFSPSIVRTTSFTGMILTPLLPRRSFLCNSDGMSDGWFIRFCLIFLF